MASISPPSSRISYTFSSRPIRQCLGVRDVSTRLEQLDKVRIGVDDRYDR
jgi:hypothetical protein